jgi:flagellar hook-associated protein 3 FlgL
MTIRPTQQATFSQLQRGLSANFARLVRAQEQVASGKRILRPSDDPVGSSLSLSYKRQIAAAERYRTAVDGARVMLDTGSSLLQDAGGLLAEARSTLISAMNGTQSADDRRLLGNSIELIRDRMLEVANARTGNRYLFGGSATASAPFEASTSAGLNSVRYAGSSESQQVLVGLDSKLDVTLPGDEIFASKSRTGTSFSGLTGVTGGTTANQGVGYLHLDVRHDSTTALSLGGGLALAAGGANDTILGTHALVVDPTTNTARLGAGEPVVLPAAGSPGSQSVRVVNEHGAEVHIDFSAWTGAAVTGSLSGAGSVSIDGTNYTPLSLTETDLELIADGGQTVLHLDTTGMHRSGVELVHFAGTVNVFDVLQGIVSDLENSDQLDSRDLRDRLDMWLGELDRNHETVQIATGELGSLSSRASSLATSFEDEQLAVKGLLSSVEDVDFSQVALEMTRAEQTLQLAQATSSRLLQTSLLNFLR